MKSVSFVLTSSADRRDRIQVILRPLSRVTTGPACDRKTTSTYVVWGTHDGLRTGSSYRDWRFATSVLGYAANYFEIWNQLARGNWELYRAYLTIYAQDHVRGEAEFLALHCDPNEPATSAHSIYKQGPHLHIIKAEHPFPHAHLALNKGHLSHR